MALQSSGSISLNEIHIEAGGTTGTVASLNNSDIRGLIDKGAGLEMSMSEWYGASNTFSFTISSNTQEANLSTLATAAGWDGSAALACTINSNVYVWSDNTATPALLINVEGATVTNNGYIIGKGGAGGTGENNGNTGGPAITINVSLGFGSENSNVTIVNSSGAYIAGGGGGGGGGKGGQGNGGGGGGAGGGNGGNSSGTVRAGGSGGAVGQVGGYPTGITAGVLGTEGGAGGSGGLTTQYDDNKGYGGWGGGRQLPGAGGEYSAALPGKPGKGGGAGNAGTGGEQLAGTARHASGGGGWGAAGGTSSRTSGGFGGAAINDNELTYTLTNNGTIYGNT